MKAEIDRENGYSWIYALDAVAVEIVKLMLVVAQPFYNTPPSLCCGD